MKKAVFLLFILLSIFTVEATCFDDSGWIDLSLAEQEKILNSFNAVDADDQCIYKYIGFLLKAKNGQLGSIVDLLNRRKDSRGFSSELLVSLSNYESILNSGALWKSLVSFWKQANQPVYNHLVSLGEGGRMPFADSLYEVLHSSAELNSHDYLRWGRILSLLGKYPKAAKVYCRVCQLEPVMAHVALSQMWQFFTEGEPSKIAPAVDQFRSCIFGGTVRDTVLFRTWMADLCAEIGLYDKQVDVLVGLETRGEPVAESLVDIARSHFLSRRYRFALKPAMLAFQRLGKGELRTNAAIMAYKSYQELGISDSALVWLKRAELTSPARLADAASFYQGTGHLATAKRLIDSLPASLPKDTLVLRHTLFTGELINALKLTAQLDTLKTHVREWVLWRGRILIFSNRADEAIALLDSLPFSPSWSGSSEILNYKFRYNKLLDDQNASKLWSDLEFLIYTGNLQKAKQLLLSINIDDENRQMLAAVLGRVMTEKGNADETLEMLDSLSIKKPGPEILYFRAEALYIVGRLKESSLAAEQILLEYPTDVFAQKARILLSGIRTRGEL